MVQPSHPYMTTGKTIALTRWTFVGKVKSLLFNMLSRFIIAFLPRSKHLLISWYHHHLQWWMPEKIRSVTVSIVFPSICHEVMGPDAMILVFEMWSFKPAFSLLLLIWGWETRVRSLDLEDPLEKETLVGYSPWGCKELNTTEGLLLPREAITNIDSILKSRDFTLPTKIHLVKAMVFPVVMYGCESWIIKKAEHQRIDAFEMWCWRRLLRVFWTARRSNQPILKETNPEYSLQGLIFWPVDAKNWVIGKDPDSGKDWKQEEKGTTEDKMVGWHHQLDGHQFE